MCYLKPLFLGLLNTIMSLTPNHPIKISLVICPINSGDSSFIQHLLCLLGDVHLDHGHDSSSLHQAKVWNHNQLWQVSSLTSLCLLPRVNFINILRVNFSYKSLLSSFSLLRVWLWTNFHTKNARVKQWWNWLLAYTVNNCK